MSGNRRCKGPDCKVRIPSDYKLCTKCEFRLASQAVMEEHADTFKKLAEFEQLEKGPNMTLPLTHQPGDFIPAENFFKGPRIMTLPTDSAERKEYPLLDGCLRYFPAALAGVSRTSKLGNDKHNPGQPLHHARGKSMDHGNCILRHLIDVQDLLVQNERSILTPTGVAALLDEASSLAWRALALSQELHERFGAPLAPGAKLPESCK